ncbi:extensin-like domain-containing protein [Neorhizobium petrolearium]|uniref:Extensin family protein n=1 Tax=Neorhizobium petrolearium TaxID=515361 RepID=A0ABY8M6U2_9HYPH|nr:extensin family protein [Neorhizobium petrolearium]MCC2609973.1 extensin family protein [Neorhizobium petrolearium]WGI70154.1 extensin family protein [Neorhizobium petrolearium]
MAYASLSRRAVTSLMISTMLVACSAVDLVPPAPIDSGTRVGAIEPMRSLPREPLSQQAYPVGPAPVSQASAVDYMNTANPAGTDTAGHAGQYLRAPGSVQSAPLGGTAPAAARQGRLPMIDSDEAMQQMSPGQPAAGAGPTVIPEEGVNMDAEFGFGPDESDVTGLAEEEDSDIAEGVGDQPVVDGIGTDNPVALQPRRQPISQPISDDRVIVPPKRQGAGLQGDLTNGSMAGQGMTWSDGSRVIPPGRAPAAGAQQVAMIRPDNPANNRGPMSDDGPMSERQQPSLRGAMPRSEASCRAELRRLGVEFEDRPRISQGRSCGIDYPVKFSGLSGNIDVKPAVTLNCQTTLAFAKWVKNELAVSARTRYLTGVRRIVPMGGYSCRRMNNSRQRYNPMSEHARGNAIDIGRIVLKNGHEIDVRKKGLFSFREGGLLKSVRNDSCKYFSTVLGPGSNAEHWNHFHFDLRSRKSGRRYCD